MLLDDIEVATPNGRVMSEDFDGPGGDLRLATLVSTALLALNLILFLLLSRLTRGDSRKLGFAFLTANLNLLVIGGLVFALVLLRAGAYPGVKEAPAKAEEAFRQGTAEEVLAEIRARHPRRPSRGSAAPAGEPRRILFLGTSQTWGAGARTQAETFVARVEGMLNARDAVDRFECINAGFSSLRAAELVPILEEHLLPLEPELMVVNLATNDRATRGGFAPAVRNLAETAIRAEVDVILIKEANDPGSMDRGQLARFAELDRVGSELGLPVIDMHGHLTALQDTGFLWWDLVHLTSYGQRLVTETLIDELDRIRILEGAADEPSSTIGSE